MLVALAEGSSAVCLSAVLSHSQQGRRQEERALADGTGLTKSQVFAQTGHCYSRSEPWSQECSKSEEWGPRRRASQCVSVPGCLARQRLTHTLTGNAHVALRASHQSLFTLDPRYSALSSVNLHKPPRGSVTASHSPRDQSALAGLAFPGNSFSLSHLRAFPSATPSLRSSPSPPDSVSSSLLS